jgi:hypothetical protein
MIVMTSAAAMIHADFVATSATIMSVMMTSVNVVMTTSANVVTLSAMIVASLSVP